MNIVNMEPMNVRRVFITFLISTTIIISFVYLVLYNVFLKDTGTNLKNIYYDYMKSEINNLYTTLKYDLINTTIDNKYKPVSRLLIYNKKNLTFHNYSEQKLDDTEEKYIKDNIDNITYLSDGFGYLPPHILKNEVSIFAFLEKGDDIYISSIRQKILQDNITLCVIENGGFKFKSISKCDPKETIELINLQSFSIKFGITDKNLLRNLLIIFLITLLVSSVVIFWTSTHFDLEEKRLITEITENIDSIERGEKPLITTKSSYKYYNHLIGEINKLLTRLSSEIDKYKVIYDKHFKDIENTTALTEGITIIYNFLTDNIAQKKYEELFKSLDILFKKTGGGIKFIRSPDDKDTVKLLILILLDILSTAKPYQLIIDNTDNHIRIVSENLDFDSVSLHLFKISTKPTIKFEAKKIIILD